MSASRTSWTATRPEAGTGPELAVEVLLTGLVKTQVPVSVGEGEELRWLLSAVGLPVDAVGRLNLRG